MVLVLDRKDSASLTQCQIFLSIVEAQPIFETLPTTAIRHELAQKV